MIKALVLTSNKPRHRYLINTIYKNFDLVGLITEEKNNYYVQQQEESLLVQEHFKKISEYELEYFNDVEYPNVDTLHLDKKNINNNEVIYWAAEKNPEVIFLFGTGILEEQWLQAFDSKIINLHLGLSPFYRGTATLFWPFFNHEIECVGTTIHLAEKKVDAGKIIERIKPDIEVGDTYYDINMKAIKKSIDLLPVLAKRYLEKRILLIDQDLSKSKLYKKKDFTEPALIQALKSTKNGITDEELKKINGSQICSCCQ